MRLGLRMKQILEKSSQDFELRRIGVIDDNNIVCLNNSVDSISIDSSSDYRRIHIVRSITKVYFKKFNYAYLFVNDIGIFPSSEDINLFKSFMRSFHFCEDYIHALIIVDSQENLNSFLHLILDNVWDALVIFDKNNYINVSHDEIHSIHFDCENKAKLLEQLNGLSLTAF